MTVILDRLPQMSRQQRQVLWAIMQAYPNFATYTDILNAMRSSIRGSLASEQGQIRIHIHFLRKALPADVGTIKNHWGRGYSFAPAEARRGAGHE